MITVLEAWEAIGHDIGMNPDKEELLDSLRYMLEKCEAHDAALARVAELERQEPVAAVSEETFSSDGTSDIITRNLPIGTKLYAAPVAQAQQLNDLDKQCRDDVARALGLRPNQERGFAWSYLLASIKSCVKASGDSAQAQHSGPEEFSFEYRHPNGESHTVTVSRDQVINEMPDFLFEALCSKFCNCEPAGETNVVECCCDEYAEEFKLLAAAPGNSVPQAWLDVQAERRRQVEAEDGRRSTTTSTATARWPAPPPATPWPAPAPRMMEPQPC